MNKIEEKHLEAIKNTIEKPSDSFENKKRIQTASKSAEITEQIAVGFAGFCLLYPKNSNLIIEQLFKEYLKTLQL